MKTKLLSQKIKLSPDVPVWVYDGVQELEKELKAAYAEIEKQVFSSKVVFDRELVNRAKKFGQGKGK
jgi:hypothetical protein